MDRSVAGGQKRTYPVTNLTNFPVPTFLLAIASYTTAITLDKTNPAYLTNRAAAHLMIQQYKEALADCDAALFIGGAGDKSKAYFRKATALKGLGKLDAAIEVSCRRLVGW